MSTGDRETRPDMGRREALIGLGAAALAGAGGFALFRQGGAPTAPRLAMPPLLDVRETRKIVLRAQTGRTRFGAGRPSMTAGFNQSYLGPTIILPRGEVATDLRNALDEDVTVHWHGLLVPGEVDGGPHNPIRADERRRGVLPVAQEPMTAWYHSHVHGATARHVYAGLAGIIHLVDGLDDERGLPGRYGIDDLTLILQDRRLDAEGRMVYDLTPTDILNGFHGNRIFVNGQIGATAAVPAGIVRLRVLNASNARTYTLMFPDGRPLHLIATDAGYLPVPRDIRSLRIASGERAEVLVDFSDGAGGRMISGRGQIDILDFAVDPALPVRIDHLPDRLAPDLPPVGAVDGLIRRFALNTGGGAVSGAPAGNEGHHQGHGAGHGQALVATTGETASTSSHDLHDFSINGRVYDPSRTDFDIARGTTERWVISGGAGGEHPFHVHGVRFRVTDEAGGMVRPENSGWKDTVLVAGQTEIVVRFDQPAPPDYPFMYHCHILEHEDAGMMGQFTVS
jgi:FtsP/CotA-like multicopper oxidase with cupredoxin domain